MRMVQTLAVLPCFWLLAMTLYAADPRVEGDSSKRTMQEAVRSIPYGRLSSRTADGIRSVVGNPSFYRRMPTQQINCDPQLLNFLVRKPEVMVNIWELMGVTKVTAKRTSDHSFQANDGVGTSCRCDLVYGDNRLHIYYGNGLYDGSMTPRKVKGRCVCILQTKQVGGKQIAGTMDVFLKLDNFGADLLTRTLGPFVAKTADFNFIETARFVSQVSKICETNPAAAQGLVMRLEKTESSVRQEFAAIAARIASSNATYSSKMQAAKQGTADLGTKPTASYEGQRYEGQRYEGQGYSTKPFLGDGGVMTSRSTLRDSASARRVAAAEPDVGLSPLLSLSDDSSVAAKTTAEVGGNMSGVEVNASNATLAKPPSAIRPRKPNVYMRR